MRRRGSGKPVSFEVNERGCFICTSHGKTKGGYPVMAIHRVVNYLHRIIYEECFGVIPDGLLVRHTCDTPACINPEHLILGTDADNRKDCIERGRWDVNGKFTRMVTSKEWIPAHARLTKEKVLEIFYAAGTYEELGRKFGVPATHVSNIKHKRTWRRMTEGLIPCLSPHKLCKEVRS